MENNTTQLHVWNNCDDWNMDDEKKNEECGQQK